MPLPTLNQSVDLRILVLDYLKVLYRRKWTALVVLAATVGAMVWYTYSLVPLYQSQASILIEPEGPNIIQFQQVLEERPVLASTSTQQQILASRAMVQRTVAALKMTERPEFKTPTEDSAIATVSGRLTIQPMAGARLMQVRARWTEPALAAEIANAHAKQYITASMERRFQAAKEATDWLDVQLEGQRKRVQESELALQNFRETNNALSLAEGQDIVIAKLTQLNADVTKAKTVRIEKQLRYEELLAAQRNGVSLDSFPAIMSNGFIQALKADAAKLHREYAEKSLSLGPKNPELSRIAEALANTEKRLETEIARVAESVRNGYVGAVAEEKELQSSLDAQEREAQSLNRRGVAYAALEREAESNRTVYQDMLKRVKETGITQELRTPNAQIMDEALPGGTPVWPRTTYNVIMSFFVGAFLAIGAAFLIEMMDDRLRTPEEVRQQIGQTLLGLVPRVRMRRGRRVSLVADDVPPTLREALRVLRTGVTAGLDRTTGPRCVLVSSAREGEGKTSVASNLAITLAQARSRVLLMDADMRRPSTHAHFGAAAVPGLSDVLTGAATLRDALRASPVAGLTMLTGGSPSIQAPELLSSGVFVELLAVLKEHFDWVIVDAPPTLAVADARVIAPLSSGVVVVVSAGKTRARAARLTIEELNRVGANVIGVVLNRAKVEDHSHYFKPYGPTQPVNPSQAPDREGRETAAASSIATGV